MVVLQQSLLSMKMESRLPNSTSGVENVDYEDIATTMIDGESFILVQILATMILTDPLSVLKFKEQALNGDITITRSDIEEIQVRYEGFSYDCEALAVDAETGDWLFFTKDRENDISEVFRYPYPQSVDQNPFTLEHIATLPLYWITGADISPDSQTLVLTNKEVAFRYNKPAGTSWSQMLVDNPEPTCVLYLEEEEQRESIAVTDTGVWTTSECKDNPPCPLWFYPLV